MADALKVIILHKNGFALRVVVLLQSEALPSLLRVLWGNVPWVSVDWVYVHPMPLQFW